MERIAKRFYRALYIKLLSTELFNSSKQPLLLNILFKSLKTDSCMPRIQAFVKRILQVFLSSFVCSRSGSVLRLLVLQVCIYQKPPFICGALLMLSEVHTLTTPQQFDGHLYAQTIQLIKLKPEIRLLIRENHTNEDPNGETHLEGGEEENEMLGGGDGDANSKRKHSRTQSEGRRRLANSL